MKRLPLYPELPLPPVQMEMPLEPDSNCTLCSFATSTPAGRRCVPPDGVPGDLLVIGDWAHEAESRLGRPMATASGKWLRDAVARAAPGRKVVWTNALGCKPPEGSTKDPDFEAECAACRPYLAAVLAEAKPRAVVLVGPWAAVGFLGRSYQALSVRTGYAWCWLERGGDFEPVPVFLMPAPHKASANRLIARAFEDDLRENLRRLDAGELAPGHVHADYEIVESEADAEAAYLTLWRAPYVATDVETSGMLHEKDFRIDALASSDGERTFVFPRQAIVDPKIAWWLGRILRELDHTTWNGQYDFCAIECEPAIPIPRVNPDSDDLDAGKVLPLPPHQDGLCTRDDFGKLNLVSDARIKRKLITADAKADLATAADLVGMGGHKGAQQEVLEKVCSELKKLAMARHTTPTGKVRKKPELVYVREAEVPPVWLDYLDQGFAEEKFAHRFVPEAVELEYVARDARTSWHLEAWTNERLAQDEGLMTVWDEVAKSAMWAWCRARMNGFPTDKAQVQLFSEWLRHEAAKVLTQIHARYPDLNPTSGPQMAKLFESIGYRPKRKTNSGQVSTSKEVLEEGAEKFPILKQIVRYRGLTHTDSNFAAGMIPFIRSDQKVHPSYLQDGSETGRASSSEPNFFNRLKGRDEESRELGNMLRACHRAPPGWSIIEADEGQIEVRKAADRSRDPAMMAMLNSGVDFHSQSAEKFGPVMGKDLSKMTPEERDIFREVCKTTNFAAIYEIPSELGFMLSMRLKVARKVGDELGDAMFKTYTGLRSYMDDSYARAWETGHSVTYWRGAPARKRPLWNMGRNPPTLADLEAMIDAEKRTRFQGGGGGGSSIDKTEARATYNGDVQGSSVDIITSMLWRVQRWLDVNTRGGQFMLQIYDSIMVLVRDEDVEKTLAFLLPLMRDEIEPRVGYMDGVPLSVDAKVGKSWDGLKKVPKPEKK